MQVNKNYSKQEVVKICNKLLNDCVDISNIPDIFYELYSLVGDLPINENSKNFCSLMVSETDWIPSKREQNLCSEEFIQKINEEGKEILRFYQNDIKKIAIQIIKEINQ